MTSEQVMDTSIQAQTERRARYNVPEFVSDTERRAWNELKGILDQHPAEIATRNEFTRIYSLLDIIDKERRDSCCR